MNLGSGFDKFEGMPVFDLLDLCEDYRELARETKRNAGVRRR